MKPTDRQKVCVNCDGRIPIDAQECLYCGAEMTRSEPASYTQAPLFKQQSLQDSLYNPPYTGSKKEGIAAVVTPTQGVSQESLVAAAAQESEESIAKKEFWALLLLTLAGNLVILGLLQLFFSENGRLQLEWNSSYWFLYCLAGLPLFYFGYKKVSTK